MLPKTNQKLHKLLQDAGLMERKADLVFSFTNQRTGSSREMTQDEAVDLVIWLQGEIDKMQAKQNLTPCPSPAERGETQKNATRRYIISVWYRMENAKTKEECKEACSKCLKWVEKHFKAKLNSFEMVDLVKIKMAAENALKDRAKAVRRAGNEDT